MRAIVLNHRQLISSMALAACLLPAVVALFQTAACGAEPTSRVDHGQTNDPPVNGAYRQGAWPKPRTSTNLCWRVPLPARAVMSADAKQD